MIERFGGEWVHTVDGKGRVSVPALFRPIIRANHPGLEPEANPTVIMIHGIQDPNCIHGYTVREWNKLAAEIEDIPEYTEERDAYDAVFITPALPLDLDPNGRIILPKALRENANINGKAVFVGTSNTFQIWNPDAFEAKRASARAYFDRQATTGPRFPRLGKRKESVSE